MVKTTIILDDNLYKELVREALERYGSTRKLSRLINEKLREAMAKHPGGTGEEGEKRIRIRLGKVLPPEEIERLVEGGWDEVLGWKL